MKFQEIRDLALEVGEVMMEEHFIYRENISDASSIGIHKKGEWVIKRLEKFSTEQLFELASQTWEMANQTGVDINIYSSLLSLRTMCVTVLALRKSEEFTNARSN